MTDTLPPYPEYKDSGVPWLNDIPAHWTLERLDRLFILRNESPLPGDQRVTGYLDGRVTLRSNVKGQKIKGVIKDAGWQRVYPGDFAISGMNAHLGGMGVSDSLGQCSPIYLILIPKPSTNAYFISEAVRYIAHSGALKLLVNTIRFNSADLKREDLKSIYVWVPPPDEQATIVRFLDAADQRIRRYIRAKQRLIGLLNEQKQAIIQQAVTRGLDPDVPLKPSGVEWLGDIPAHWEIVPLKNVSTIQTGITLGKKYTDSQALSEFPYLRVANVQAGHLNLSEIKTIRLPIEEARRSMLVSGDVLMTEGGDPDKLGRGCVWQGEVESCLHQNHVFAVRPNTKRIHAFYLSSILGTHYAKLYFLQTAKQTTNLASTNKTTIGLLPLVLPPLAEQSAILEQLNSDTMALNKAVENNQRQISLIREYRTRLIADVVTGKIDVRAAAFNMPEPFDDAEALDEIEALAEDELPEDGDDDES